MERALKRLRRAVMRVLDVGKVEKLDKVVRTSVTSLLEGIVKVLEAHIQQVSVVYLGFTWLNVGPTGKAYRRTTEAVKDTLTTLFDACFVLARIRLDPGNVDTYTPSVHLLECAVTAVNGTTAVLNPSDSANFLRCISGAYHNLGGTLYKANKYGGAIRFLRQGCDVGFRALQLHTSRHDDKEAREDVHP